MTETLLLTGLSMDNPSTLLSMDSGVVHDEQDRRPPDINLPFAGDAWFDMLDVGLASQNNDMESITSYKPPKGRRSNIIWGAWFFFNHYFRPALTDKCSGTFSLDGIGSVVSVEKADLKLDHFIVQHDMENIYMWVFKEKPENAFGKMQLRSYMNGHAKHGEPQFPFGPEKGFVRSHKMQRKQYKSLSNPQCIHGIELVRCPNLSNVSDEDKARWLDLTGRELNFSISMDAADFETWRGPLGSDLDNEKLSDKDFNNSAKKQVCRRSLGKLNGAVLNLGKSSCLDENSFLADKKKRKESSPGSSDECCPALDNYYHQALELESLVGEQPRWLADFKGVMAESYGPVTAAKSIYEDENAYLILVSLPLTNIQKVRVSWLNVATHGIVKIHCISAGRTPYLKRGDRTFELADPYPEHCPPGEFVREIALVTRIPEDAQLEAYYNEAGAGLEIIVPKQQDVFEEREVRVFLPPQFGHCDP